MIAARTLAFASVSLATVAAHGQIPPDAPPISLAWSAPPECPDRDAVLATIARSLSRTVVSRDTSGLSVAARVTHATTWHLQLAIISESGETSRTFDAENCARLADATALILALAIDPDASLALDPPNASSSPPPSEAPPPAPSPSPPAVAPPPIVDPERTEPAPLAHSHAQRPRGERAFNVGAGFVMDAGTLPGAGGGVELRLGTTLGAFRAALRADYFPTRSAGSRVGSLQVDLLTAGGQACYAGRVNVFEVRVCGALDVGVMSGSVGGQGGSSLWSAMFVEVGLAWRPTRIVSVRFDAGPGLTLASPRFISVDASPINVFQPAPVVARAGLYLEFYL